MKTILVPTDFSKNAENALLYAINLAKRMSAKIILLHSFHVDYTSGLSLACDAGLQLTYTILGGRWRQFSNEYAFP